MSHPATYEIAQFSIVPLSNGIRAKRVRFSPRNNVIIIERYKDMTSNHEKTALWYTNQDEMRFQHSIKKTIRM
eukprot:14366759-Ditylum_brightwellii.AAC.1